MADVCPEGLKLGLRARRPVLEQSGRQQDGIDGAGTCAADAAIAIEDTPGEGAVSSTFLKGEVEFPWHAFRAMRLEVPRGDNRSMAESAPRCLAASAV